MTCKVCGRTILTRSSIYGKTATCQRCLHKRMEEEKKRQVFDALKKSTTPTATQSVNIQASPHVPPGQAFVFSGDLLGGGSDHVIAGADFLSKFVASTMSPEELKAGLGLVAGMDHEVAKEVIDKTAKIRTGQIDSVRDRIKTLLRPVVDDDMGDQELEGLANALMAAMAVLGGGDVMSIYGVSG